MMKLISADPDPVRPNQNSSLPVPWNSDPGYPNLGLSHCAGPRTMANVEIYFLFFLRFESGGHHRFSFFIVACTNFCFAARPCITNVYGFPWSQKLSQGKYEVSVTIYEIGNEQWGWIENLNFRCRIHRGEDLYSVLKHSSYSTCVYANKRNAFERLILCIMLKIFLH